MTRPVPTAPPRDRSTAQQHIRRSAKGGGFLVGGSYFEMGTRFVIAFLLARAIGATGYGLYNLAVSAGALFGGLAALGLDDAMVRYVAIQARQRDERGLRGTLQIGIGISVVCGVALGVVLSLGAAPIADGVFHEPGLAELLRLFGVIVPFMTLSNVLAAIAKGFKRMDYAAFSENVVMSLVRVILLAVLTMSGLDVTAAVIVFGISDVAASIALVILVNREIPLGGLVRPGARREYREVFAFALPLWLSGLLLQLRKNMETLVLGALSVAANVGLFSIVARINLIAHVIYRAIVAAVKPALAELGSQGEREELTALYRTSTRWTYMCTIPFFLVMVLYPRPLLAVFGAAFTAGAAAMVVLAVAELVNAVTGTSGSIVDMTGHTRVKLANSVAWLVLLLAGNVALIPRWGVLGAAVASLLATAVINVARVIEVWILERAQPYDRTFVGPTLAGVAAYGAGLTLGTWGPPAHGLIHVGVYAALVTAVYGGVTYLLGLAPEDRDIIERGLRGLMRAMRRRRPVAARTTSGRQ
jgi:O-antigen/teichoic acid export membrane protein